MHHHDATPGTAVLDDRPHDVEVDIAGQHQEGGGARTQRPMRVDEELVLDARTVQPGRQGRDSPCAVWAGMRQHRHQRAQDRATWLR